MTEHLMNRTRPEWTADKVDMYLDGIDCVSIGNEAGFSWSACECCDGPAGDRIEWTGRLDNGDFVDGTCCIDCAMYLANGETPEED